MCYLIEYMLGGFFQYLFIFWSGIFFYWLSPLGTVQVRFLGPCEIHIVPECG